MRRRRSDPVEECERIRRVRVRTGGRVRVRVVLSLRCRSLSRLRFRIRSWPLTQTILIRAGIRLRRSLSDLLRPDLLRLRSRLFGGHGSSPGWRQVQVWQWRRILCQDIRCGHVRIVTGRDGWSYRQSGWGGAPACTSGCTTVPSEIVGLFLSGVIPNLGPGWFRIRVL